MFCDAICPRVLVAVFSMAVSVLTVSCQTGTGTAVAWGEVLDRMVTVNGRPFSQGMAKVGNDIRRVAGVPAGSAGSRDTRSSAEPAYRSPEEEAERSRLRAELSRFRSDLGVGDSIIFYEMVWLEREVIQVEPGSVSVRWNSNFRSAKRIDMEKVFPAYWDVKTIRKSLDSPNIARASVDHRSRTSSSAELDANYAQWKAAKAEASRQASVEAQRQAVLEQARQEERDRSTGTLYRCEKCGEERFKTGKYQDLTPGGTCSAEDIFIFGHTWQKIGRMQRE